jgi:hypothetical protein
VLDANVLTGKGLGLWKTMNSGMMNAGYQAMSFFGSGGEDYLL